jgi:hypothetical protein
MKHIDFNKNSSADLSLADALNVIMQIEDGIITVQLQHIKLQENIMIVEQILYLKKQYTCVVII